MAGVSVTYSSIANATSADPSKLNVNFNDLVLGTTDGTKVHAVNALELTGPQTWVQTMPVFGSFNSAGETSGARTFLPLSLGWHNLSVAATYPVIAEQDFRTTGGVDIIMPVSGSIRALSIFIDRRTSNASAGNMSLAGKIFKNDDLNSWFDTATMTANATGTTSTYATHARATYAFAASDRLRFGYSCSVAPTGTVQLVFSAIAEIQFD